MQQRIALGSDHAGFDAKEQIKKHLTEKGLEIEDLGTFSKESCDYPDYARKVAEVVAHGECARGVLVCGSGIGVSIVANKVRGVRAALCHNTESAKLSRQHNDANVLCLAGRSTPPELIPSIVDTWLATEFEGGRHKTRVDKIEAAREGEEQPAWFSIH